MRIFAYGVVLAGAGFMAAATLMAGDEPSSKTAPESLEVSTVGIIKARRSAMMMSGANMAAIKGAIDRSDDPKTLVFATTSLVAWSNALPAMFPAGSNIPPSAARPEIWSDRDGFDAAAKQYSSDAAQLRDYAKTGDKENFSAQWTKLRSNCAACHDKYKVSRQP
jgi:cytochrome c556